jgi:capsular polysaccharide biosynthesis protein/Mrp family chromosome partitioning ATPase
VSTRIPRQIFEGAPLGVVAGALRRRAWVIALCAVLAGAAALVVSLTKDDQYKATSSILYRDPAIARSLAGMTAIPAPGQVVQTLATYAKLASLDTVAERTASEIPGMTPADVNADVTVDQSGTSSIVAVTAEADQPELAAQLANTYTRVAIDVKRESDRRAINGALAGVRSDLERARLGHNNTFHDVHLISDLIGAGRTLRIFRGLQPTSVMPVQAATVPTSPSSPRPLRDTVLAFLLGAVLGAILALLLDRLDPRLRDDEAFADAFGVRLLGVLSNVSGAGPADTSLRDVLARLRYADGERVGSLGLASATDDEGRSFVSTALAEAAAISGVRTLLIAADATTPADPASGSDEGASFDRLSPDDVVASLRGSLSDQAIEELMRRSEGAYELVIVDAPPLSRPAEALPLLAGVSGIVAIGRLGRTTRSAAEALGAELAQLPPAVLGVVAVGSAGRLENTAQGEFRGPPTTAPDRDSGVPAGVGGAS